MYGNPLDHFREANSSNYAVCFNRVYFVFIPSYTQNSLALSNYEQLIFFCIMTFVVNIFVQNLSFFMSLSSFFHSLCLSLSLSLSLFVWRTFANHRTAGEREGISLTPLYHFYLLHRHLDISRAITAESSPTSAHS